MMIYCDTGRLVTFKNKVSGRYLVQFILSGGKSYTYQGTLSKIGAENIACSTAKSHPSMLDMELNEDWLPRFPRWDQQESQSLNMS